MNATPGVLPAWSRIPITLPGSNGRESRYHRGKVGAFPSYRADLPQLVGAPSASYGPTGCGDARWRPRRSADVEIREQVVSKIASIARCSAMPEMGRGEPSRLGDQRPAVPNSRRLACVSASG